MAIDIGRRQFISALGSATAMWPLAARAQQPDRLARIGYLRLAPAAQSQREENAFREGLRDLGYVDGQTIRIAAASGVQSARLMARSPGSRAPAQSASRAD
jgi:hypothetical protein